MQKSVFIVGGTIVFVIIVLSVLMYSASQQRDDEVSTSAQQQNEKFVVVATIFPLYDIVRNITGDVAQTQLLLPPGASPHFFEFTPQQINDLKDTDVAFVIGQGADDWAHDALVETGAEIVTVDKGITLRKSVHVEHKTHGKDESVHHEGHQHGDVDPHYWLSPENAMIIAQTIADTLVQEDPDNASVYQQNVQNFIDELTKTDRELQSRVQQLLCKDMIVLHSAWYYFAQHFGFDIVGVFMPETGEIPSPQHLVQLDAITKESCGYAIFSEPQLSTRSIETFAHDNGLTIAVIDPIGGVTGRDTYIELMVYNIDTIVNALQQ